MYNVCPSSIRRYHALRQGKNPTAVHGILGSQKRGILRNRPEAQLRKCSFRHMFRLFSPKAPQDRSGFIGRLLDRYLPTSPIACLLVKDPKSATDWTSHSQRDSVVDWGTQFHAWRPQRRLSTANGSVDRLRLRYI